MNTSRLIDLLNDLLAAEYGNMIQRLDECNPFVTWPAEEDRVIVTRMSADAKAYQRDLAALILKLRGSPRPPTFPTETGGVHYLNLSYLMPQVIAGVLSLIRAYEAAGGTGQPEADGLMARILADHRRHLAELERLHSNHVALAAGR